MTLVIDFAVEDEAWVSTAPWYREVALRAAECALTSVGRSSQGVEISVLLCSDERIAGLNSDFRGKPSATNVLSWPAEETAPPDAPHIPADGFIGDVALARETVETEALAQHLTIEAHFAHLFAHGVLHLLGYDHETDADAKAMEAAETRALGAMGIRDPYARSNE